MMQCLLKALFDSKKGFLVDNIKIALVGKISEAYDSYSKVKEAVNHAASYLSVDVDLLWVDSNNVTPMNVQETLKPADGVILLGGFGKQGTEGMIVATKYAREKSIPLLGICLGMQIIIIEFARSVLGYQEATSEEFDQYTKYPVVHKIAKDNENPLRQGVFSVSIQENSLAASIYQKEVINESFRHSYGFNVNYENEYQNNGLKVSGRLLNDKAVEIVEIPNHPFFIGVQYHPEFQSSLDNPHPLFVNLFKKLKK